MFYTSCFLWQINDDDDDDDDDVDVDDDDDEYKSTQRKVSQSLILRIL